MNPLLFRLLFKNASVIKANTIVEEDELSDSTKALIEKIKSQLGSVRLGKK